MARSELTSACTSNGEPSGTSVAFTETATRASMPERSATDIWRLLLDVSRSLPAETRASAAKFAALVPRATRLTCAAEFTAMLPNEQVAVRPDTEQLPCELVPDSKAAEEFAGNVTTISAPVAPRLPMERTVNGNVNGAPPSPVTEEATGSSVTSAYCAGVMQFADAITRSIMSMLHWENVA